MNALGKHERLNGRGYHPASESLIPITIDDRERKSGLVEWLQDLGAFEATIERLHSGDYRVDARFLFERKTIPDLAQSIASGRLFKQALRLACVQDVRPVLVIEGTATDWRACGLSREAVQGALITVALFIGLPIMRTSSPEETARTFLFAARQGRTVAMGALPRRGRRPKGKVAAQFHLLQGLPGVGSNKARRLLERFGSVQAVMTASEDELVSVPGIGRETARRIAWAVNEEVAEYRAASGW